MAAEVLGIWRNLAWLSPSLPAFLLGAYLPMYLPICMLQVSKQLALDTFSRHTLVFSNVPGPEGAISFAGKEVKG